MDLQLVKRLIARQFPEWKDLPIRPVAKCGWDNYTFHLGDDMIIRMPSAQEYASQVEKEQKWLPFLAPQLPISIPFPIAMGELGEGYPLKWSIYKWIKGESAADAQIENLPLLANDLAQFLKALHKIDSKNGPIAGPQSFYRGASLSHYDIEVRDALDALRGKIDTEKARMLWEEARKSEWKGKPVWVHGDLSAGNLLLNEGKLSGVIDFGQLAIGDPACDLAIAWTLFKDKSRDIFIDTLPLDEGTWIRGKAWALWKALIVAAGFTDPGNYESKKSFCIICEVLE